MSVAPQAGHFELQKRQSQLSLCLVIIVFLLRHIDRHAAIGLPSLVHPPLKFQAPGLLREGRQDDTFVFGSFLYGNQDRAVGHGEGEDRRVRQAETSCELCRHAERCGPGQAGHPALASLAGNTPVEGDGIFLGQGTATGTEGRRIGLAEHPLYDVGRPPR